MAPDGRMYNATGRKGELAELRAALNATDQRERRKAVKRVVAAMTLGRDVSSLFPDVIKNAMTDNLAMKKLVYLYVINYARQNPELIILVINTFVKDAADPNPLIRALSIRTMALVRMEQITEHLVAPLHAALADGDPYVRKTAAVAVAKLHDTEPALVRSEGFIAELQALLSDPNPMTVANAVAALSEIAEATGDPRLLQLDARSVPRFLATLGECTEWGQVFVLDAIAGYSPSGGADEARAIVERVLSRMQHANPAVVLAVVRVVVGLMPMLREDEREFLVGKMRAPLVTLLRTPPEMQYVALRNVSLILRAEPRLFDGHSDVFYAAYNDPLYVKVEKLDILVRLADGGTARAILSELKEYAGEVDLPFVTKAIAAIGRLAARLPSAAPAAVAVLTDLLASGRTCANTAEEVAVVLADILRVYPGEYVGTIAAVAEASETIVEPSARAALVWLVGQHAAEVDGAADMMAVFAETFAEETLQVQLQILTATVKVFLTLGGEKCWAVVQRCIAFATDVSENADLRERGIVYARILGASLDSARAVVLAKQPGLKDPATDVDAKLLKELLGSLGSVAAVYRLPIARFRGLLERSTVAEHGGGVVDEEDLLGLDDVSGEGAAKSTAGHVFAGGGAASAERAGGLVGIDDFLGTGDSSVPAQALERALGNPSNGLLDDILGPDHGEGPSADRRKVGGALGEQSNSKKLLLSAENGKGLAVSGGLSRRGDDTLMLDLVFENRGPARMNGFAIQLKRNAFGLAPTSPLSLPAPLRPGESASAQVPLGQLTEADAEGGVRLHMAFKFTSPPSAPPTVVYCSEYIIDNLDSVLEAESQGGRMDKAAYLKLWAATPDAQEVSAELRATPGCDLTDADAVVRRLEAGRIFLVAKRTAGGSRVLYVSALVSGPLYCQIMAELTLQKSGGAPAKLASRSPIGAVAAPFLRALGETCQRLLVGAE
jgi:vesicle coat complex subunit